MRVDNRYAEFIKYYRPIKSKRFLCNICLEFLWEDTAVVKAGRGKELFTRMRADRNMAIVLKQKWKSPLNPRLRCPQGHHESPHFTFRDVLRKGRFKPT